MMDVKVKKLKIELDNPYNLNFFTQVVMEYCKELKINGRRAILIHTFTRWTVRANSDRYVNLGQDLCKYISEFSLLVCKSLFDGILLYKTAPNQE